MRKVIHSEIARKAFFLALALCNLLPAMAEVSGPEKLLPADTLFIASVPDYAKFRAFATNSPQARLWGDPEMRPFREKLVAKWMEEFVKPLERELDIRFSDYSQLPQGQLTLAVTPEWVGQRPRQGARGNSAGGCQGQERNPRQAFGGATQEMDGAAGQTDPH